MATLEAVLNEISEYVALVVEAAAVVLVGVASAQALVRIVCGVFASFTFDEKRAIWLEYARWLVAGLTFQLAADIVHTTISPTWDDIGQTGATAVIRTLLTFFLDRDITKRVGTGDSQ
jgi:uncharacterized membrane protein